MYRMKKLTSFIPTALFVLTCISTPLQAGTETKTGYPASTKSIEPLIVNTLITRLHEIENMDKSKLNALERKQLRKEVRSIEKNLKEMDGRVYISVGALILIIILLIILL